MAGDPLQTDASPDEPLLTHGKFQLKPLAHFALDARVLRQKIYRYDRGAALVPVDLAVGWGPMSDQAVLDRLKITQASRFFFYEYKGQPPIAREEITAHATNLHLIPSSKAIAAQCKSLRAGDLIHLAGLLVKPAARGSGPGAVRSAAPIPAMARASWSGWKRSKELRAKFRRTRGRGAWTVAAASHPLDRAK